MRADLLRYFGGKRCVIRGDANNSSWHHLDDNESNAAYENFLPLGSSFNTALRDARREAKSSVPVLKRGALRPDALLHQAAVWHAEWQTGLAYGCARLSYYVATAYLREEPDRSLRRACDAIYYARHRFDVRLLEDILRRDILPQVERGGAAKSVGANTAALILGHMSAIYSEFGMASHAAAVFEKVDAGVDARVVDEVGQAALLRRRAMVAGTLGSAAREVNAQLRESIALAQGDPNAELSAMNTRAWLLQRDGDWSRVASTLEPLYNRSRPLTPGTELQPNALTAWNVAELFLAYGTALAVVSRRRHRATAMVIANATAQFAKSGTRTYELMPGHRATLLTHLAAAGLAEPRFPHPAGPMPRSLRRLMARVVKALDG